MKAVKYLVFVLAVVFISSTVHAKDLKIAYVDLGRIFDSYQKTKDYDVVLQKEGDDFQKQRDEMVNKLKDMQGKMALMKDDEKKKMTDGFDKEKNNLIDFDKNKRSELTQKRNDKVKEILQEIQKIVEGIATKEGYTYVLNDRVMVYGDKEFNLSDMVLKALNDSYKK